MSLFANLVVSDGTDDRTFVYRGPESDAKRGVRKGVYIEPAADPSIQSQLVVKHDETSAKFVRHLLQTSAKGAIDTDGTLAAATVNITINHHPNHDQAFINELANIAKNLIGQAGVVANLRMGMLS